MQRFINIINKYFTIYVFTSASEKYANKVCNTIEQKAGIPKGTYFKKIFSRNDITPKHTTRNNHNGNNHNGNKCLYKLHSNILESSHYDSYIKNHIIEKKIKKTLIIDNLAENYDNYPDNGIHIIDYIGQDNDMVLTILIPFLIEYAKSNKDFYPFYLENKYMLNGAIKN